MGDEKLFSRCSRLTGVSWAFIDRGAGSLGLLSCLTGERHDSSWGIPVLFCGVLCPIGSLFDAGAPKTGSDGGLMSRPVTPRILFLQLE